MREDNGEEWIPGFPEGSGEVSRTVGGGGDMQPSKERGPCSCGALEWLS